MAQTVKNTCVGAGYVASCYSASYSDSNCVKTGKTNNLWSEMSKALCRGESNAGKCPILVDVCMYMKYSTWTGAGAGAAYCNLKETGTLKQGQDYSNKTSLCAWGV